MNVNFSDKTKYVFEEFDNDMKNENHTLMIGKTRSGKSYFLKLFLIQNCVPRKVEGSKQKISPINKIIFITQKHNIPHYTQNENPKVANKYFNEYLNRVEIYTVENNEEVIEVLATLKPILSENPPENGITCLVMDDALMSEKLTKNNIFYTYLFSIRHANVKFILLIQYSQVILNPAIKSQFDNFFFFRNDSKQMKGEMRNLIESTLPQSIPEKKQQEISRKLFLKAIDSSDYGFIYINRLDRNITCKDDIEIIV